MTDPGDALDPFALFRLDGRVAIVTGASSGLGQRFARVLHAAGAQVVVSARRRERLDDLADALPGTVAVECDVTRDEDLVRLVELATERAGAPHVLVNNAGIAQIAPAEHETPQQFRLVLETNLIAAQRLAQLVAPAMLERGSGSIINVASVFGTVGSGQIPQAGYVASKSGLLGLTRELAAQWARKGIRVNSLAPGYFETEMTEDMFVDESGIGWIRRKTPMGRAGEAHELDGPLLFLASDASSYVTGHALAVDGGFTIV